MQNKTHGGYFLGRHHSEETKRLLSQLAKDRWKTPTLRKKQSETRKKLFANGYKNPMFGRKHSKETREKISKIVSKTMKKKWKNPDYRNRMIKVIRNNMKNEETRRKISIANKGKKLSKEICKKRSNTWKKLHKLPEYSYVGFQKGSHINKGHKHTKELKKKQSKRMKKLWQNKEYRNKIITPRIGKKRPKHSKIMREKYKDPKYFKKWHKALIEMTSSPEHKKNMSESSKKMWQRKEYREKTIKAHLKGLFKRPTSLEKQMIKIIKMNNLPYRYVGDGSLLIGYKNPDFANINGEKICVEVANTFHHSEDYPQKRKEYFKKWGWDCIVFRTDELTEDKIILLLG